MRRSVRLGIFLAALVATLAPEGAGALSGCKAKLSASDGTIFVQAKGVTGTLGWGTDPADAGHALLGCTGSPAAPQAVHARARGHARRVDGAGELHDPPRGRGGDVLAPGALLLGGAPAPSVPGGLIARDLIRAQ